MYFGTSGKPAGFPFPFKLVYVCTNSFVSTARSFVSVDKDWNTTWKRLIKCTNHRPTGTEILTIKDEDNESGRGGSLPQSPLSHEHQLHDSGVSSGTGSSAHQQLSGVAMSLCGGLKKCERDVLPEKFIKMQVTMEAFSENPGIINDPNLVVRIDNK